MAQRTILIHPCEFGLEGIVEQLMPVLPQENEQLGAFADSPYGQLFKAAWLMFRAHPFTGVGMQNFRLALFSRRSTTFPSAGY